MYVEETRDSSATKPVYELTGMIGEIMELLKEGKTIHQSFNGTGYLQDVFVSSVDDFASELNKKSHFLYDSAKEFIGNQPEKGNLSLFSDTDSGISSNDAAERREIQLNEQQKHFLISKGPYQPVLEKFTCDKAMSKSKQKSFSSKWYNVP